MIENKNGKTAHLKVKNGPQNGAKIANQANIEESIRMTLMNSVNTKNHKKPQKNEIRINVLEESIAESSDYSVTVDGSNISSSILEISHKKYLEIKKPKLEEMKQSEGNSSFFSTGMRQNSHSDIPIDPEKQFNQGSHNKRLELKQRPEDIANKLAEAGGSQSDLSSIFEGDIVTGSPLKRADPEVIENLKKELEKHHNHDHNHQDKTSILRRADKTEDNVSSGSEEEDSLATSVSFLRPGNQNIFKKDSNEAIFMPTKVDLQMKINKKNPSILKKGFSLDKVEHQGRANKAARIKDIGKELKKYKNYSPELKPRKISNLCLICGKPMEGKQVIACFAICEHAFHEDCLFELILGKQFANKKSRAGGQVGRLEVDDEQKMKENYEKIFCPMCHQMKLQ